MKKGTLYGVGVGPGDPKLMTYLAVETIENCPVLAIPADGKDSAISYKIASGMVKGIEGKYFINLATPMTKDRAVLDANYRKAADAIITKLDEGLDVAYLTLGDPTIYSTYIYIHRLVKESGYHTEIINGIPSFCAVASKLGDSLGDRSEQIHIIPSSYDIEDALKLPGNKILMKAASKMKVVKDAIIEQGLDCQMIENCGLNDERIHIGTENIPDTASYYTIVLVKETEK